MIQARNIDLELPQPFSQTVSVNTQTSYTATINCSTIPTGINFLIIVSGYVNIDGGTNHGYQIFLRYNSVNVSGFPVWANALASGNTAIPSSSAAVVRLSLIHI